MSLHISSDLVEELKTHIPGRSQIVCPDDSGYDDFIKRWSDLATMRAGLIVFPESSEDVSEVVRFANRNKLDLAVVAGGHSGEGSSSSDGGIVIDLRRMKKVFVHTETETVIVQGGALWGDVNNAAAEYDLAVVSSTVSCTGVGGVTLLGGYGFLTPEHGLVIDNLLSVQIVIANGEVLTASETENPDLFWAVRGAGPNFGVVVEFAFRAHKQPNDVWAGSLTFTPDKLPSILEALNSTLDCKDGKTAAECMFSQPPEASGPVVTVVTFYNGPENEGKERFAGLLKLDTVSADTKMVPYKESNTMFDAVSLAGGRKMLIGFDHAPPLRAGFARQIFDELELQFKAEPDIAQSYIELVFFEFSRVCQVPSNATAFACRAMTQKGAVVLHYTNADKDHEYLAWGGKVKTMFEEEFKQAGHEPNIFVSNFNNYMDPQISITVSDMFGANGKRLIELKQKFDPNGIFNKSNPIKSGVPRNTKGEKYH